MSNQSTLESGATVLEHSTSRRRFLRDAGVTAIVCHILPHAESDRGMFGMVTALVVQK